MIENAKVWSTPGFAGREQQADMAKQAGISPAPFGGRLVGLVGQNETQETQHIPWAQLSIEQKLERLREEAWESRRMFNELSRLRNQVYRLRQELHKHRHLDGEASLSLKDAREYGDGDKDCLAPARAIDLLA